MAKQIAGNGQFWFGVGIAFTALGRNPAADLS